MKHYMSLAQIDLIFPFLIFAYGAMVSLTVNSAAFERLSQRFLPAALKAQLEAHRHLALLCLVVGSIWSLQNLWLA